MARTHPNSWGARSKFKVGDCVFEIFRLEALEEAGAGSVSRLPFSLKILLENLLRHEGRRRVKPEDIEAVVRWDSKAKPEKEIAFSPARVLLQDFTGVPAMVDLAAMREAMWRMGGDPQKINPLQPADLVIDHSVQVDRFGCASAFEDNAAWEFERNRERYLFLRWGQQAFCNFRVVPPDTGIVHQVNLEYLASVVSIEGDMGGGAVPGGTIRAALRGCPSIYPDTVVGTDSHTTMVNGLGVVGWGVGGIEAEAVLLGQPISMLVPQVVGLKLTGELPKEATATDLVLTVTQKLRAWGVVGKFVEFYGPGLDRLSLADRATVANMAPEYGATIGFFPVDQETLNYLRLTGREEFRVQLVEAYTKEQGLFRTADTPDPIFSDALELDLGSVEPSLAGPRRPQDRIPLAQSQRAFRRSVLTMLKDRPADLDPEWTSRWIGEDLPEGPLPDLSRLPGSPGSLGTSVEIEQDGQRFSLTHGSVVIAAITSCTNTSNPAVMIGAGLLAKKAVERGLQSKPWVKTSLAPGSKVVIDYLRAAGLLPYLEALRFHLVGYGCTTCIGNSGPLPAPIDRAIREGDLVVAAVLSGNRNFEGRINPLVRANYLASPPLVVAYALAGKMDLDLDHEPLAHDPNGEPVFLRDLWPTPEEIQETIGASVLSQMFREQYREVFAGDERWKALVVPMGDLFSWDESSTYIKCPPYFENLSLEPPPLVDLRGARVLVMLGDSVTTDHISPAGFIPVESPAGQYLLAQGVAPQDFNSYGARRGNHEVMVRGTFGNIRLRNLLAPGAEGGWTLHLPSGERMWIYDAARRYQQEGIPLIILAGKEYGVGSSRDWAAKGPLLLGVRAVLAESFERIHRSNLVGMGVLPLQFKPGENRLTWGLTGHEVYAIEGLSAGLKPGQELTVRAAREGGESSFPVLARLDTPDEVEYYRHGGILQYVLRQLLAGET